MIHDNDTDNGAVNWNSFMGNPPSDPAPDDGPGAPLPDEPGWVEP